MIEFVFFVLPILGNKLFEADGVLVQNLTNKVILLENEKTTRIMLSYDFELSPG